jgi:hypothetical protein
MSSINNQNNIYPKSCVYNCNTQIYWNVATNEYWQVFTKKHICPNRSSSQSEPTTTTATSPTKPTYYNKKPWSSSQPKPKMSNSFEYLQGSITEIQKKYEILSDIMSEYNGKFHGSQGIEILTKLASLICWYIMKFP